MSPLLFVPALIALAIVFGVLQARADAKRRLQLLQFAVESKLKFDPSRRDDVLPFSMFQRGMRRQRYNTLSGSIELHGVECPLTCGDFRYRIQHGKSSSTRRFSYLLVGAPFPDVPGLSIRRENLFDQLADALGFDDIDFESEEFSRQFRVKCGDKKFAWDLIDPRMMELLMNGPQVATELSLGSLVLADGSREWSVDEFRANIEFARRFFAQWPDHLTARLAARRTGAES